MRYSLCVYGTPDDGFTYLLSDERGLVQTNGIGSDFGQVASLTTRMPSVIGCAFAAISQIRARRLPITDVAVHAPGDGKRLTKVEDELRKVFGIGL